MKLNDKRIKQKTGALYELKFNSWDEFISIMTNKQKELKSCIYRGQHDPSWELLPSLYRRINTGNYDEIIRHSNKHLDEFKKHSRGRHKISYTDPNDSDEIWWTLGQHYGLATPLLDWVRSPYVAAYFSFNEYSNDDTRSIHILDIQNIKSVLEEHNRRENRIMR